MASTTLLPTDPNAVSSDKAVVLCHDCRNHVHHVVPLSTQCSDLAPAAKAACPAVIEHIAELPSPADAIRHAKEPKSDTVAAPRFDCSICLDGCQDPVVTHCGHLFCWPCLYCWLSAHSLSYECPVCRAPVRGKIVPLYGRGEADHNSPKFAPATSIFFPEMQIPCRPMPSNSPYGPSSATGAADEITAMDAIHQRGIYHSRSVDYVVPSAAPDTVLADHGIHHRGVSRHSRRRSSLHGRTATAGSTSPGRMIYVAQFMASILSRCSRLMVSSSPAAHDHSGSAYADGSNPVRPASRRRFGNGKEFVLHWVLICVVSITSLCLLCSC